MTFLLPGALASGFIVYLVLSIFLMPFRIVLPASIIISILVGTLTKHYADPKGGGEKEDGVHPHQQHANHVPQNTRNLFPHIIFAATYVALLITVGIFYGLDYDNLQYNELFESWQQFSVTNVIKLSSAIGLSFFFPGYAIITIISDRRKQDLRILPKILLAYILSIGTVGFLGYITAMMDFAVSDIKLALILVHVIILVLFLQLIDIMPSTRLLFKSWRTNRVSLAKARYKLAHSSPEIIVFASLLGLVILSTYVLYNGVMVGDQWFHHGRALQFITGDYKAITISNTDFLYPPLLSAFLSAFFVLADVPTVNAYASIGFLNIISVFAFYYFLQNWTPLRRKRSALLAVTLFVLSSGVGWIYAISTFANDPGPPSQNSALLTILGASKQTYDIRSPSTFLLASHPDISTGLQLIVLPVGFVLLGIIKDEKIIPKFRSYITVIISAIVFFGILSHDEIYFFTIIACILPILFGLRGKGFIYLGILSANGIAIFANYVLLEGYLSATVIMGTPLIVISFFFVMIAWAIYSSRILEKLYYTIGTHKTVISKVFLPRHNSPYNRRAKFTLSVILVSVVLYLYFFSYITWAELSVKNIEAQTSELFPRNVPWYLYPMKLGLAGILGLCFALSYIFRRFEKEIFVFGVIVIVAIITGPYYDEHRFNKYVMVGLVGFASLFIYDVIVFINNRFHYGPLLSGMLVGSVIVLSCLSTLMYVGFQASSIETNNLDFLWEGRRNFPSPSELQVLQFLRNNTDSHFDSAGIYNIVTWPNEYQLKLGLIGKFEGFLGLPIPKMLQSPLALNASALESFYNLLARSDTRFIVVPSPSVVDKGDVPRAANAGLGHAVETGNKKMQEVRDKEQEIKPVADLTDVMNFALVNFDKIYQDGNFVILAVPTSVTPPSSLGDIAMIHSVIEGTSIDLNNPDVKVTLPYTNKFFNRIANSEFAEVSNDKKNLLLYTYNKSQTLWSRDIEYGNGNLDYIEAKFRTLDQNRDKKNNECGIVWESEGEKKYYVRIKDDKLEFSETPATKDRLILENLQVKLSEQVTYTLKLIFSERTLSVYVDDILGLQIPNEFYQGGKTPDISRIGIRCSGSIAEFEPIKMAQTSQLVDEDLDNLRQKQQNYQYYYPLSTLALSGEGYDTFLPNDYSIFSKDNIILTTKTFEDYYDNNGKVNKSVTIDKFLDYVKNGGKLTVISTESPTDGWFEEAFAIRSISNNNTEFNSVVESTAPRYSVNLLGTTPRIGSTSPDVVVKSYYQMNNQNVSPFALEKSYGKGKIILVNAAGFFDAISREPEKYFSRLADIPILVGINSDNNKKSTKLTPIPPNYNLGNLRITGTSTINSSSLLLASGNENISNRYFVEDVSILANNTEDGDAIAFSTKAHDVNNSDSITQHKTELGGNKTSVFKNILMKSLELQGLYNVTIKSFGTLQLPSQSSPYSKLNYVSLSLPKSFDMILTLSNDSSAQITLANGTEKTIEFGGSDNNNNNNKTDDTSDSAQIYFHNIQLEQPHGNPVSVLMKRPEILAHGNATFDSLFQGRQDFDVFKGIEGNLFETSNNSTINLKLDYVDSYYSSSKRKQTTDYITYIDSLNIDRISENGVGQHVELRIPGDISDAAKQAGIEVPWKKAFSSNSNIAAITFLVVAAGITILIVWPRLKNHARAPP